MTTALSTRMIAMSPPGRGASLSPRSTAPRQPLPIPCAVPDPTVMTTPSPWISLLMMRAVTGSTEALSQLGLLGSGFLGSGHAGNLQDFTRRSIGFGHGIVSQHLGLAI